MGWECMSIRQYIFSCYFTVTVLFVVKVTCVFVNSIVQNKQVRVEPLPSALNMTLPALAIDR